MKKFLIICFVLMSGYLLAQDPPYLLLGEEDFANTDIYTLLYDDQTDILYVGTNNGLFFYKQNKFTKLNGPKDQIGNSFFDLKKDQNGNVFCSNLKGQIFKVKSDGYDIFYQVPLNRISRQFNFYFDKENRLIISDRIEIRLIEGNKSKLLYKGDLEESIYTANQCVGGQIFWDLGYKYYGYYNNGDFKVKQFSDTVRKARYFLMKGELIGSGLLGSFYTKDRSLKNCVPKQFGANVIQINDSTLFSMSNKKGVRIIRYRSDSLFVADSLFNNEFVSTFTINNKGTLFLGSFRGGIKVVNNYENKEYHFGSKLLLDIAVDEENTVYLSTRSGEIYSNLSRDFSVLKKEKMNVDHIYIQRDFINPNGILNNIVYSNKNVEFFKGRKENLYSNMKDLSFKNDSAYFVFRDKLLMLVTKEKKNYQYRITEKGKDFTVYNVSPSYRPVSIHWQRNNEELYFSDNFGTFQLDISKSEVKDSLLYEGNTFIANDLNEYKNILVAGTEELGVLFFQDKKLIKVLNKRTGLMNNTIRKIRIVEDLLFALTSDGLQVYDLAKNEFCQLGFNEGVIDKGVSSFDANSEFLWIMHKSKAFSIPISEIKKHDEVDLLWIDSILVNSSQVSLLKKGDFNYDENFMEIYFDYRNIETKNDVEILYTLEGFYNEWKVKPTSENVIQFESLPPGEYLFKIKAKYGVKESEQFVYKFEISSPIWYRWWFYLLLVLSVTFILYLYFKILLKRQKKSAQIERELNTSKLTAIRSQMNPHFIFNSLNSIQALVLKGDVENSYSYINKFSNLVRNTLTFSDKEFIDIELEIELLNTYLSLEQLRFRENFQFEIEYSDVEGIKIPPLLIQPFIENAIVHGLLHKEGLKQLEISFELGETLVCTITDNGVGRAKSKEINERQRPGHQSFAVSAVQKKLELLKSRFTDKIGFKYYDLEEDGESLGTTVIIHLPYVSE